MDYPRHVSLGNCLCRDCVHLCERVETILVDGITEQVEVPFCWVKRADVKPDIPRPCSYYSEYSRSKEPGLKQFDVVVSAIHVYRVEAMNAKEASRIGLQEAALDLEEYTDVVSVSQVAEEDD